MKTGAWLWCDHGKATTFHYVNHLYVLWNSERKNERKRIREKERKEEKKKKEKEKKKSETSCPN